MGDARVPFLDLRRELEPVADELKAATARVIDRGWFVLGDEVTAFEREFAAFEGRSACIGVGNGLDAIRLALEARGIGRGDEVIVPAMTFIATALAALQVGAKIVLADVEPGTLLLDPVAVARVVTPRTRAALPVHLYGQLCDVPALRAALPANAVVIEDAAQAHGARRHGAGAASGTVAATYSFYPGKNLGALGDGGAVTTDDPELADAVRVRRNYGAREKYLHTEIGLNSRLDEMQAAALRVRLTRLAADNAARARVAARYHEAFEDVSGLTLLAVPEGSAPAWHLYPVRHARRDALAAALADQGIGTLVHYPRALHEQPALRGEVTGSFPVAERAGRELLSLPMAPTLREDEITRVIEAVRSACTRLA